MERNISSKSLQIDGTVYEFDVPSQVMSEAESFMNKFLEDVRINADQAVLRMEQRILRRL